MVPGNFFLKKNACNPVTGDELGNIGDCVVNEDFQDPIGNFMDINIYRVKHKITNQELYVTQDILERWKEVLKNLIKCGKMPQQTLLVAAE